MGAHDASIDSERVASLLDVLGGARLGELLRILEARLSDVAAGLALRSIDPALLGAIAHQARGSASSLGLPVLAGRIGELEMLIDRSAAAINDGRADAMAFIAAIDQVIAAQQAASAAIVALFPELAAHYGTAAAGALKR